MNPIMFRYGGLALHYSQIIFAGALVFTPFSLLPTGLVIEYVWRSLALLAGLGVIFFAEEARREVQDCNYSLVT